jgi:hypothetical protein
LCPTKTIPLHYFSNEVAIYEIILCPSNSFTFDFNITDNMLLVRRTDNISGWGHCHSCFITITSKECIYLFIINHANILLIAGFIIKIKKY